MELSGITKAVNELKHGQKRLEGLYSNLIDQQSKVMSVLSELKDLVTEQNKKNFSLKNSGYEVLSYNFN